MVRIYAPTIFTGDELTALANGKIVDIGGKRYGMCRDCRKVVRLNKPLLGDLHLCLEEEPDDLEIPEDLDVGLD